MREGKLPRLAQIAIGAILQNRSEVRGRWAIGPGHGGFLVCDTNDRVGKVVARTRDLADATLLAAAPVLKDALDETSWVYKSIFEESDGRMAAQDAGEEDAHLVDSGLTRLREVELMDSETSERDKEQGK